MKNNETQYKVEEPRTKTITVNGIDFEFLHIQAGTFVMGSGTDEVGRNQNEGPAATVQIADDIYLGRFPVTRIQYDAIMNPGRPAAPDDNVARNQLTWLQATEYCRILARETGLEVRLPFEAEWEYACRAGTQSAFHSGNAEEDLSQLGWYAGNSNKRPQPVGQKQPNAWGLYDMHGNVWELCADYVEDYDLLGPLDPVGTRFNNRGAMRGGGSTHPAVDCRCARRMMSDDMFGGAGFRMAITIKDSLS